MKKESQKRSKSGQEYRVVAIARGHNCDLKIYYGKSLAPVWQRTVDTDNLDTLIDAFWREYLSYLEMEINQKIINQS